jgi:competence protein ComEC
VAGVALAVILVWLLWARLQHHSLALFLLAFALGGLRFGFMPQSSPVADYNGHGFVTLRGVVADEPDVRDTRIDLRIDVQRIRPLEGPMAATSGLVLVQAPPTTEVHYGDEIVADGVLRIPGEFDTFSYRDYLSRAGIYSIMQDANVRVLSSGKGSPVFTALLDLKGRARQNIIHALPEPDASLLVGILLGDSRGLAPEVSDAFNDTGTSHIIAISGFNMAILSGVVMGLLSRFRFPPRLAAFIGIATLVFYTLFVGASPSVVRAAIMSSMLVVGGLIRRKTYVPTSLAFVALLMSLLNPLVLWDVGFQLSLFATLGLSLFTKPFQERFNRMLLSIFPDRTATTVGDFLAEPLIVSLAAQITSLPLILLYFGRLSLVSFVVNLLVIPVQAALMILGLAATLIGLVLPSIAQFLFWFDMLFLSWTLSIVRLFARLPFAVVNVQIDPRLIVLFYLVLLGGGLMQAAKPLWAYRLAHVLRLRVVTFTVISTGAALTLLLIALLLSRPDGNLHVWMLDMGENNAVLIQTPGGAQVLVDGGQFPSRLLTALGDRLPFNDREIEALVITHPDRADIAALPSVLDRYDVQMALTNGQITDEPEYQAVMEALQGKPVLNVYAGYSVDMSDGTRLEVLSPQQQPPLDDAANENTLSLRLSYGEIAFLLTSDLDAEGQLKMLRFGVQPSATVLQIPDHGAAQTLNARFLAAVQPSATTLQSNPASRFGDADPDTVKLVDDIPLFRTDQMGTLHFWSDGHQLWISPSK